MKVGDTVVCVKEKEERSDPICTPLKKGQRYRVLGARDANLRPPADPARPQEIRIVPGDAENDRLGGGWWYSAEYFEVSAERNDTPRNVEDMGVLMEIDSVGVAEWHPLPDGQGLPTQVHVMVTMKDDRVPPFVLRLKSARACDELINALLFHRQRVFGPRRRGDLI